ncbi:MAG TPA: hypothetical protein VGY56_11615 [Verrucomicrobiae bacterium]|nr:hypothetical protein [Verrucomicrobiae bacterium]
MNDIAREYLPTNGNDNGDHKKAFRILPNDQPDFAPINARDRVIEDNGLHPGARLMFVRILDLSCGSKTNYWASGLTASIYNSVMAG